MREEKLPRQEREMRRRGLNSSDRSFSGWTDGSYNYLKVQVFFFYRSSGFRIQKTSSVQPAVKNHLLPLPVAISVCPVMALHSRAAYKIFGHHSQGQEQLSKTCPMDTRMQHDHIVLPQEISRKILYSSFPAQAVPEILYCQLLFYSPAAWLSESVGLL